MKKILVLLIFITPCALSAQVNVTYDYDKRIDFSAYKTFDISEEIQGAKLNDLNKKRLMQAISEQMTSKGYTQDDQPDLLIEILISVDKKVSASAYTDYYGMGYRYRWGGGFSTTDIDIDEYLEGTIFIDLIDTKINQLVWQGRGVGTVHPNVRTEKKEKRIKKGTRKIFKNYPPSSK